MHVSILELLLCLAMCGNKAAMNSLLVEENHGLCLNVEIKDEVDARSKEWYLLQEQNHKNAPNFRICKYSPSCTTRYNRTAFLLRLNKRSHYNAELEKRKCPAAPHNQV